MNGSRDTGMNVLVVGGSGYLGAGITQACLRAGARVRVVSRRGTAAAGEGVRGDVRRPRLGLPADVLARVRAETTHAVLCFGPVSWATGPGEALETHDAGMRTVLAFLRELPALEQAVHVSSLLALGRAKGRVTNRELYTGQRFRNWYEYGKYRAERLVRDAMSAGAPPIGVVRFGPVLGPDPRGGRPDTEHGLPAAFPHLLAGYPVHLGRRGDFPCWVTDVHSAAEVVVTALRAPIGRRTWTWFDPALPTLREVFIEVCRPWGTVPKIVDAGPLGRLTRLLGERVGTVPELVDYAEPWFDLDPAVLREIPEPWPTPEPDYLGATGRALLAPPTVERG
ncbi:Nucleoside-diphosphate-sugar epimerase [Amycolatopsis arida]|uniref:Nucleoside-diphosphate-sugar epimerase n=1 Tax=Amycolatopsis arida TaxID=587909 RepID=A0A1I5V6E3_9PSEU|nr:SDR family oxidoreductase [Amycolatopsis arida]TDX91169.1 nucleoside-diphosphate-sugar epimerase [Amycolatopsis arida]SFQ03094.1 Nucleoside-diphosphate-sugar epimerase [Amycolatopsis arida]